MTIEKKAQRFVVSGHVQGVGFRYATRESAQKLGIRGWVRNRPDGAVEVVATGSAQSMAEFERWLNQGPRHARVDRCDCHPVDSDVDKNESVAESEGFSIRR